MKAPMSKTARQILADGKASKELMKVIREGGSGSVSVNGREVRVERVDKAVVKDKSSKDRRTG